jgi:hypothetical protein
LPLALGRRRGRFGRLAVLRMLANGAAIVEPPMPPSAFGNRPSKNAWLSSRRVAGGASW